MFRQLTIQWFYSVPTCVHVRWVLFLQSEAGWWWYWDQCNTREQCTTIDHSELADMETKVQKVHTFLNLSLLFWARLFPLFQPLIYAVIFVPQSWAPRDILSTGNHFFTCFFKHVKLHIGDDLSYKKCLLCTQKPQYREVSEVITVYPIWIITHI